MHERFCAGAGKSMAPNSSKIMLSESHMGLSVKAMYGTGLARRQFNPR
jgi:hypothetical protein